MPQSQAIRFDQIVPDIIQQKTKTAAMRGRRLILRQTPRFRSIKSLERTQLRELRPMLDRMLSVIRDLVIAALPSIIQQVQAIRPKADSARSDDFSDDIKRAMDESKLQFAREFTPEEIAVLARVHAERISAKNAADIDRIFGAVLGVDIARVEPFLATEIKAFVQQNVSLITSIPNQFFDRVEQTVIRDVTAGKLAPEIAKDIRQAHNVSKSRAALIARDQTNKFNGNLNQLRQTNVGITQYRWQTSLDERVRPTHRSKEGKVFSWDDPPADTGHPGQDINCVPEDASVSLHALTKKAYRRWFSGELTKIVSEAEEHLYTTPNHPVLTLRGWIPAHLVKVGDYLVETTGKHFDGRVENPQCRNTKAKEMFRTLREVGLHHRITGGASRFHGDSAGEDVDVIEVHRRLMHKGQTKSLELIDQDPLTIADKSRTASGHVSTDGIALPFSTDSCISLLNPSEPLSRRGIPHAKYHGFTSTTSLNTALDQNSTDHSPTDTESFSDGQLARAILITPDDYIFRKVKAVVRSPWSGWVHNFETITGWFSSVNLVIHNCRCTAIPIFEEE